MGAHASGAQNAYGFQANMRDSQASLPAKNTITYQGVFNEHSFPTGDPEDRHILNIMSYGGGKIPHWTNKLPDEIWVATFLKSCFDGKPRGKQPIDIMISLDISGSMNSHMEKGKRLDLAKSAVLSLLAQLRPDDGFGILTFNHKTIVIQSINYKMNLNLKELEDKIVQLIAGGGTNLNLAMTDTVKAFKMRLQDEGDEKGDWDGYHRERRIVFLTDMQASGEKMSSLIMGAANLSVHTTIIGIGMNFNADLSESVTKNRGASYHCVTRDSELQEVIADEFQYNFFPCCYDVELTLSSHQFDVARVYGTPFDSRNVARQANWTHLTHKFYPPVFKERLFTFLLCCNRRKFDVALNVIACIADFMSPRRVSLTEINTVFPSAVRGSDTVGGLILLCLKPKKKEWEHGTVDLDLTFADRFQPSITRGIKNRLVLSNKEEKIPAALEKGLLLQRYVALCRGALDIAEAEPEGWEQLLESHIKLLKEYSVWIKLRKLEDSDKKLEGLQENIAALADKLKTSLSSMTPPRLFFSSKKCPGG